MPCVIFPPTKRLPVIVLGSFLSGDGIADILADRYFNFEENSHPEIRKTYFFGSKMGGQLIHGIDLYTGKYGKSKNCDKHPHLFHMGVSPPGNVSRPLPNHLHSFWFFCSAWSSPWATLYMLLGNLKIFDSSLLKTSLGLINLSVKHGNAKANYIVLQYVNF